MKASDSKTSCSSTAMKKRKKFEKFIELINMNSFRDNAMANKTN